MDGSKAVTATFDITPKAKVGSVGYASLAAAYAAAESGSVIFVLDSLLPDIGLILNQGKSIFVKGGYQNDYSGKSGLPTLLKGPFSIRSGKLTVEGLAVQ